MGELAPKTPERISRDEIAHVAKLARLKLCDAEIASYQKDLNSILDYVETLRELDTEQVSPMSHVLEVKNVWREDKPGEAKETDPLLSNAPMSEKGYYKVPKILEG
jgi:aspartyl/glutamyl-tRNA(Asn/Gln) amidotransferase C subunit